jgi:hypothetical protein
MNTPIAILEERATYISADGSSQRREDIYVRLSVSFRHEMLKVLKGARLSVFLCLALHGNAEMESWPSISTIAEETGYSDRVVRHAIHSLETMKLVASESRYSDNGGQTSNRYTIAAFVNTPPTKGDTPPVQKCNPPLYESVPGGGCSNVQSKNIHIEEELTSHHEDGCDVDTLFPLPSSLLEEKRKTARKEPDTRLKLPAIRAIRTLTKKNPPKGTWDKLIAVLGDNPDEKWLNECYVEWLERGYNPMAVKWATEWYKSGIPGRGSAPPKRASGAVVGKVVMS